MRTKTSILGLLAAVALAVGAGPDATPRLSAIDGPVEIGSGEPPVWRAARAGDSVHPGESVRVGAGGRAELVVGAGRVRLYENSLLRLPGAGPGAAGPASVDLDRGESLFDVDRDASPGGFEVRTPEAVVTVKGTRFAVALDEGVAAVSVFRGVVAVREPTHTLEHAVLVRSGFSAILGPELPLELVLDELPDPWDGWPRGERLEPAAERAREASPAKIAAERARSAALRAARAEAFGRLARNDPELARRLRAAYAAKLAEQTSLDRGELTGTDPIGQVTADDDGIEETLAGEILSSSDTGLSLDVKYRSDSEELTFLDSGGQVVAKLTEADVDRYLSSLDPSLIPDPVRLQIQASGLSPEQYMGLLDDMFFD